MISIDSIATLNRYLSRFFVIHRMLQISGLHKVGHHQGVIGSPTMDVPLAAEAAKVHRGFTGGGHGKATGWMDLFQLIFDVKVEIDIDALVLDEFCLDWSSLDDIRVDWIG
jgi:hypothetical protein